MGKIQRTVLTREDVLARLEVAREKGTAPDFRHTEIRDCVFTREGFRSADFTGAKIVRTDFTACDLRFTRFRKVKLRKVNFYHSDMRECKLTPRRATECSFYQADFAGGFISPCYISSVVGEGWLIVHSQHVSVGVVPTSEGWCVATPYSPLMPVDKYFETRAVDLVGGAYPHPSRRAKMVRELYSIEQIFRAHMGMEDVHVRGLKAAREKERENSEGAAE